MKKLILASKSTARRDVLCRLKIDFQIYPSDYKENMDLEMNPRDLAIFLSNGKASDIAGKSKNAIVLGVDSFAVLGNKLFCKPKTRNDAKKMLRELSGKVHIFISGFTIIDSDTGKQFSDAVETKVYFRKLTDEEIDSYLKKENTLNNAGSYIIQQLGGLLIEKIEGDYFNVVGLPLAKISLALKNFGINLI